MRTITIEKRIDPNTYAPMKHLYLGENDTGIKYSMELPFDLMCMDDESKDLVMETFYSNAIDSVLTTIPDITEEETRQLLGTIQKELLRC